MIKVILDDTTRSKLASVSDAELCDHSGKTVGHFLSEDVYRRLVIDWANAQITDEELQQRLAKPGGRSLAEIWQRLRPAT